MRQVSACKHCKNILRSYFTLLTLLFDQMSDFPASTPRNVYGQSKYAELKKSVPAVSERTAMLKVKLKELGRKSGNCLEQWVSILALDYDTLSSSEKAPFILIAQANKSKKAKDKEQHYSSSLAGPVLPLYGQKPKRQIVPSAKAVPAIVNRSNRKKKICRRHALV